VNRDRIRRVKVSRISITFRRCMAIVEVCGDSWTPETTRYLLPRRCWIGVFIKVQSIDDANEDRFPVPAHESGTREHSVVAPYDAPPVVRRIRMKYMSSLPHP
jgi:hypothetical protein